MFSKKISLSLAAVAASAMMVSAAQAAFVPTFTATITSTGSGTSSPVSPLLGNPTGSGSAATLQIGPTNVVVNSSTGAGLFFIDNFTATSNSPASTTSAVEVGSSVQIMNTSASTETLTIVLSDTGFKAPTGTNLVASAHGTVTWAIPNTQNSTDVVTTESVVNGVDITGTFTSNTLNPGTSKPDLSTNLPLASGSLNTLGSPYTLGSLMTLQLNGGDSANVVWYSTVAAVPEPTSAALMGMGGLGALLLLGGRRRKIKA